MSAKTISCRAAVLWKEGTPLTLENITVDPPQTGEVRIRMVAAGLCASDGHFIWGLDTDIQLELEGNPIVFGHEGAGIVESIGPEVTSVEVGDHVILMWLPQCNRCEWCSHPNTNLCLSSSFESTLYHGNNKQTRMKINGKPLLSFTGTSTFSEYSVVKETQIAKITSKADLKSVCIIGCAVGTGYASAVNLAKVHSGSKCAVWGLGAIGLSAVLGCKQAGAKQIIGVDINDNKESIAREFGCTHFVNPSTLGKSIEEYFKEIGGLDYAFDCIGNQQVLDSAYNSLNLWGSLVVIGLGARGNKVVASVAELLNGRKVMGAYYGNQKPRKNIENLVDKYISGDLPIDGLITHRIRLDDISEGFDKLKSGKTIRTIIEF
ncbi:alcohol dehydrogenase class-3 chain L-like [Oppia nitens]|uniref:alcohol dehydrogenase class-3 chain L-like n=1 Tax=Oppia nitens TaxID=1686743 RepID=UPI0023D9F401|nr:alcohol dehydrogenase class-3 chain L-like [Oppia nitens]